MEASAENVIRLPNAASDHIRRFIERYPVYAPVADRLPSDPGPFRARCERSLSELFRRTLHAPRLTREQAAAIVTHDGSWSDLTKAELVAMAANEETAGLFELWFEVWKDEEDEAVQNAVCYFAALLARLYRLEFIVRYQAMRTSAAAI